MVLAWKINLGFATCISTVSGPLSKKNVERSIEPFTDADWAGSLKIRGRRLDIAPKYGET